MVLSLIAALTKNRVIGNNQAMPWHLPNDFRRLKAFTLNKSLIMGRRTFESLKHPLSRRRHVVLTQTARYTDPNVQTASSFDAALELVHHEEEIIIFGGQSVFEEAIECADFLYLTLIDAVLEGDAFFPIWSDCDWMCVSRRHYAADARHAFSYDFVELKRKKIAFHS